MFSLGPAYSWTGESGPFLCCFWTGHTLLWRQSASSFLVASSIVVFACHSPCLWYLIDLLVVPQQFRKYGHLNPRLLDGVNTFQEVNVISVRSSHQMLVTVPWCPWGVSFWEYSGYISHKRWPLLVYLVYFTRQSLSKASDILHHLRCSTRICCLLISLLIGLLISQFPEGMVIIFKSILPYSRKAI